MLHLACFLIFCMGSCLGKILTIDMLMKGRWPIINRCNFCKDDEELANHILIHCDKTRMLWTFLVAVFGTIWVFFISVRNILLEWKFKGLDKKRKVQRLAPVCLFWCIWKEYNWRTFDNDELSDQRLKEFFIKSLLEPLYFGFLSCSFFLFYLFIFIIIWSS